MKFRPRTISLAFRVGALFVVLVTAGCGTTTQRAGTEQLLMSDAVDLAVAQIDFSLLAHQRVYLDTGYLQSVKGFGFVNAPYIISSLRQQLTAAGCLLQDDRENADIVVEARVGALGTDGHEVIYGLPKNNMLSSAAAVIPNAPNIPVIPEISAARVDAQSAIAKLLVFAYDSETRQPVWQSGVARAESTSRNSWVLGAGPFQRGSVYEGTRFAGSRLETGRRSNAAGRHAPANGIAYFDEHQFDQDQFEENRPPVTPGNDSGDEERVAKKPEPDEKKKKR